MSVALEYAIYCLLASRPLLRQIENLQSSHQNQAQNWERIEKNLTERLGNCSLPFIVEKNDQYNIEMKILSDKYENHKYEIKHGKAC